MMLSTPRDAIQFNNLTLTHNQVPKVPYRTSNYMQELQAIKATLHQIRERENSYSHSNLDYSSLESPTSRSSDHSPCNSVYSSRTDKPFAQMAKHLSNSSSSGISVSSQPKELRFWRDTVPKELLDSLTKNERLRQECIYETIYTEREFINTLKLIDRAILKPIKLIGVFNDSEFDNMKLFLFNDYEKILRLSEELYEKMVEIQNKNPIVENIYPAFLDWSTKIDCFAYYGANIALAQNYLSILKERNPGFAQFIDEMPNNPNNKCLPILSFMNAPTTRLARMPLLLNSILKYTLEGTKDHSMLPHVVNCINELLNVVDKSVTSGK